MGSSPQKCSLISSKILFWLEETHTFLALETVFTLMFDVSLQQIMMFPLFCQRSKYSFIYKSLSIDKYLYFTLHLVVSVWTTSALVIVEYFKELCFYRLNNWRLFFIDFQSYNIFLGRWKTDFWKRWLWRYGSHKRRLWRKWA